jgi:hypothetical protein
MTSLPPVKYCMLCEDVRFEQGGKYSVIGMFGILPDVSLLVQDLQAPIQRLAFLVVVGHKEGSYHLSMEIERPNKEKENLVKNVPLDLQAIKDNPEGTKGMMVVVKSGFIPKESGEFKFTIYADDQLFYQNSFLVNQGKSKDPL